MEGFPKYNKQRKIGDKGVSIIRNIVEDEFNWIFRPVHLEDDFGIDGYIDIIGLDNSVTGKSIAVQIKSGDSYFKSKTNSGWTYRGENKHLNYYLNNNHPLLLVIVDLNNKNAYWTEFNLSKTSRSTNGWSINISKENKFSRDNKNQIQLIAGDIVDYMSQIEYQWEINDKLKESSKIMLNVDKSVILKQDTSGFTELLDKLTIDDEMIKKSEGKLSFFIDGYNDDVREIYEIPEVRIWSQKVLSDFKYWGYFLDMEEKIINLTGLKLLMLCTIKNKYINKDNPELRSIEVDPEQQLEFLDQIFYWLNEFCELNNISQEINDKKSSEIAFAVLGIKFKFNQE
ncbi:DUF4365 and DUF1817 domain-containing protein [Chryseobacterium glaciei]|uniref:DUF4365 and DUF1817 domain-containing protein n=1 Tax=Chryseobacterium glaciei TaxID=1685010 RepID=UPI0008369A85|nr:DUF4365 and DUF1817 domain-containing protein [Chryseobacterium glaciei]